MRKFVLVRMRSVIGPETYRILTHMRRLFLTCLLALATCLVSSAAGRNGTPLSKAISYLDDNVVVYDSIQKRIWGYNETCFNEVRSSQLLSEHLASSGFAVEKPVAGLQTAFVARYGKGRPVIGILAEYDALPGLSQDTVGHKSPIVAGGPGHGCGHNLIGTGSVAAAVAMRAYLDAARCDGTIVVYGCPAEEGGSGKAFMAMRGVFSEADVILDWHPGSRQRVYTNPWLANVKMDFSFYGKSAHASAHPEDGRSALDAVEAMNHMTNMMREHIPATCRIHYFIPDGGMAANVVPDYARVQYYFRAQKFEQLDALVQWATDIADAAALGTQTRVEKRITGASREKLLNRTLQTLLQDILEEEGTPEWNDRECALAMEIYRDFETSWPFDTHLRVQPLGPVMNLGSGGSSDVGDVSWNVPNAGFEIQTFVPGSSGHCWQNTAVAGTTIGTKAVISAARVFVRACVRIIENPEIVKKARAEFDERRAGKPYRSLMEGLEPPLRK